MDALLFLVVAGSLHSGAAARVFVFNYGRPASLLSIDSQKKDLLLKAKKAEIERATLYFFFTRFFVLF